MQAAVRSTEQHIVSGHRFLALLHFNFLLLPELFVEQLLPVSDGSVG